MIKTLRRIVIISLYLMSVLSLGCAFSAIAASSHEKTSETSEQEDSLIDASDNQTQTAEPSMQEDSLIDAANDQTQTAESLAQEDSLTDESDAQTQAPETSADTSEKPLPDLTLMVYMCGSNLEEMNGSATADLMEMMQSGFQKDEVQVLVMAGGSQFWMNGYSAEETSIYMIIPGSSIRVGQLDRMNMGDPETLLTFLRFGYERFPAQKHALIFWDHGGGPLNGVCWDTLAEGDNMTMDELCDAMSQSPFAEEPLEWVGFDACLMSAIETADMMAPYARYMIASQDTEPAIGWSYSFLKGIGKDQSGADTGERIIESFFEAAGDTREPLTLSCMDLSKTAVVADAMDAFFQDLSADLDEASFSEMSNLRQQAAAFGRVKSSDYSGSARDLVDLTDLITHYCAQSPEKGQDLLSALDDMIVHNRSSKGTGHGLSIYHPYQNKELFLEKESVVETSLGFAPGYLSYVEQFTDIWLGDQQADWTQLQAPSQGEEAAAEGALYTAQLTSQQMATYGSGELMVLQLSYGEDFYTPVYMSDEVTLDESGELSAYYTGRTLYVVDSNNEPIAGPIQYEVIDGQFYVQGNYIQKDDFTTVYTSSQCTLAQDGHDLQVDTFYVYDPLEGAFSNRIALVKEDYDWVFFPFSLKSPVYGEDGQLLPYSEWQSADGITASESIYLPMDFHFRFFDELLSPEELFAAFQLTDTQANVHMTPLVPVTRTTRKDIAITPEHLETDTWSLDFACGQDLTTLYPGTDITITCTNRSEEVLHVSTEKGILLNGDVSVSPWFYTNHDIKPGEEAEIVLALTQAELVGLDHVDTVSFPITIGDETEQITLNITEEDAGDISGDTAQQCFASMDKDMDTGTITAELYDIEFYDDHTIKALLHCINHTEEELKTRFRMAVVNQVEMSLASMIDLEVPVGTEYWQIVEISTILTDENNSFRSDQSVYTYVPRETIESITLLNTDDESSKSAEECFDFALDVPVPAIRSRADTDLGSDSAGTAGDPAGSEDSGQTQDGGPDGREDSGQTQDGDPDGRVCSGQTRVADLLLKLYDTKWKEERGYSGLEGTLYIANGSTKWIKFELTGAIVNDQVLPLRNTFPVVLPPGKEMYRLIMLKDEQKGLQENVEGVLAGAGIHNISEIRWLAKDKPGDWASMAVDIPVEAEEKPNTAESENPNADETESMNADETESMNADETESMNADESENLNADGTESLDADESENLNNDVSAEQINSQPQSNLLIFDEDDLQITVEGAIIEKNQMKILLAVSNSSEQDSDITFIAPVVNKTDVSWPYWSAPTWTLYARSEDRLYLEMTMDLEALPEVSESNFFLFQTPLKKGKLKAAHITFQDPVKIPEDGTIYVSAADLSVESGPAIKESRPILATEIAFPADAESFRHELRFSPGEEITNGRTPEYVYAVIVDQLKDTSDITRQDGSPVEGVLLGIIGDVVMHKVAGEAAYEGTYSGLVLTMNGHPSADLRLLEGADEMPLVRYKLTDSDGIALYNKASYSYSWFMQPYLSFDVAIDYTAGTAAADSIRVKDDQGYDLSDWPADWFESYAGSFSYQEYSRDENGIINLISGDKWNRSSNNEIQGQMQLSLDPAQDHFEGLSVVYIVGFSDDETVLVLQDY